MTESFPSEAPPLEESFSEETPIETTASLSLTPEQLEGLGLSDVQPGATITATLTAGEDVDGVKTFNVISAFADEPLPEEEPIEEEVSEPAPFGPKPKKTKSVSASELL